MIRTACEQVAARRPQFGGPTFTPHDYRRRFATDLVNNGLPIQIGAALLGHASLQTTRGYVAVFDEDVVRHYQLHLTRRRPRQQCVRLVRVSPASANHVAIPEPSMPSVLNRWPAA